MASPGMANVSDSIKGLFGDSRCSDLDIICGDRKWHVHKAVVCTRCKFFEKAVDGRFKESASNTIDLPDDPPNAVDAMISWLYTDWYDPADHYDSPDSLFSMLPFNMHVHAVADKYSLDKLTELALYNFEWYLRAMPETGAEGFYESIRLAFGVDGEWNMAPFREPLLGYIMRTGKTLVCTAEFQETAAQVPAFAAALVVEAFRLDKREDLMPDKKPQINLNKKCYRCGFKFSIEAGYKGDLFCPKCARNQASW